MINMDDDDVPLHQHPFFQHLQKSNVLDQACKKGYIIALPPAQSLPPNATFTRDFSLSHILLPSKRTQGQHKIFHTLLSRTLILRGDLKSSSSTLCTVSTRTTSWPERREVGIVNEETYYTESFESFPIFHISLPLYGPIDQNYLKLVNAQTLSKLDPIQRAFNDHVMVILTTLGEEALPTITQQTQALVQQLKTTYQLIRNFEANLQEKIDTFCSTLLVGLLSTLTPQHSSHNHPYNSPHPVPTVHINAIRKQSDGYPLSKKNWAEIILAVHFLTATKLSSYITRRISEIYHEENNIVYNAALWAQSQLQHGLDEDGNPLQDSNPDLFAVRMKNLTLTSSAIPIAPSGTIPIPAGAAMTSSYPSSSSSTASMTKSATTTHKSLNNNTNNNNNHNHNTNTTTHSLVFLPHPTQNQPHPNIIPPQLIRFLPLDPLHSFFVQIGLREELSCVDFTIPALKLREVLSTVEYSHDNQANQQPTELYQPALMLQSGLLEVNSLIQTAVLNHYTSPLTQSSLSTSPSAYDDQTLAASTLLQNGSHSGLDASPLSPTNQSQQNNNNNNDKIELSPEMKSTCAISAEDLIPLLLYLLVIAPTYTIHSQCIYLCTFSPISLGSSTTSKHSSEMGFGNNNVGLPQNPAEMILPVSKLESLCISLRAAVGQLYQLYSSSVPNQVYLLQQTNSDRPPAHTAMIRVTNTTLRTSGGPGSAYHTLPRVGSSHAVQSGGSGGSGGGSGGGLNIFAGNSGWSQGSGISGSPPTNHPLSPTNGRSGGFLSSDGAAKAGGLQHHPHHHPHPHPHHHMQGTNVMSNSPPTQQLHTVNITHTINSNLNKATTLSELDNDLVQRLQAESRKLDAQNNNNNNNNNNNKSNKKQVDDDDDDDFLATLM